MQHRRADGTGDDDPSASGAVPDGGGVRIALTAVKPPPARRLLIRFLLNVVGIPYWRRLHTVTGPVRRELIVGPAGIRHVDTRRIRIEPCLSFDVSWNELARVALQIQLSSNSPLQMLRIVLHAVDPSAFGAAHPTLELLHDLPGLGTDTWALSLGTNDHIDQQVLIETRKALGRYAGDRFSGEVESVPSG